MAVGRLSLVDWGLEAKLIISGLSALEGYTKGREQGHENNGGSKADSVSHRHKEGGKLEDASPETRSMHHLQSEEALSVNVVAFLFSVPLTLARVSARTNRQGCTLEGCARDADCCWDGSIFLRSVHSLSFPETGLCA